MAATVSGPDVSRWQHGTAINWSAVKSSGQSFVFVKATEGSAYTNPYFAGDWSASRNAGLFHGAYHFARPSVGSAVSQARRFIAVSGTARAAGELPPVLDLEESGGLTPTQLVAWTQQFLGEVKVLTGRNAIVYTYPYFWKTAMANSAAFTAYPLWIASYSAAPTALTWPSWTFWQYSATSTVSGIAGQVDMNRFNGTYAQLQALANIRPTVVKLAAPTVSVKLSATTTRVRSSVTMSGKVSPASAGQKVYRQGYYGGAWHTWASTTVSSTGGYSFRITPTVKAVNVYRSYVPASHNRPAAKSATVRLTVR